MAKKLKKKICKLVSSAGTGVFFIRQKTKNVTEKLSFKKYDPKVRKHVLFEEKPIK